MPLSQTLAPAIRYAEEGFEMSRRSQLGLKFRKKTLLGDNAFSAVFYPGGEVPEVGDVIKQPDLAATIKRFAADGMDGFYAGETADLLVAAGKNEWITPRDTKVMAKGKGLMQTFWLSVDGRGSDSQSTGSTESLDVDDHLMASQSLPPQ